SSGFGVGRHLDARSRVAYREGLARSMGAFHDYLRDARFSDAIYDEVARALTGPFRSLPLLTIFGERNDPLGFQPQWKQFFRSASRPPYLTVSSPPGGCSRAWRSSPR